jgi:hypothetical protein
MKKVLPLAICLALQLVFIQKSKAQEDNDNTRMFRVYVDNDFLNIRGKGTDDAYTAGERLDFFYTKHHASHFFVDRIMPKAGDGSVDVFGWSVMQIMFTPQNFTKLTFQPNDYPYSGGFFAIHSLYSYNPVKKYSFQTEILMGVMGPAALQEQLQMSFHHFIHYKVPQGWGYQLGNNPLLNVNFTAEKQFAHVRDWLELSGGAQALVGTAMNGLTVYPMLRIGKMNPYYNGLLSQYGTDRSVKPRQNRGRRVQAYIVIKPELQTVFTNALLEGGIFSTDTRLVSGKLINITPANKLNNFVFSAYYGAGLSLGKYAITFIQNSATALIKNTYDHEFGNVSMYYSW